jgi:hypothetical protein
MVAGFVLFDCAALSFEKVHDFAHGVHGLADIELPPARMFIRSGKGGAGSGEPLPYASGYAPDYFLVSHAF